jgi:hypothetical protein
MSTVEQGGGGGSARSTTATRAYNPTTPVTSIPRIVSSPGDATKFLNGATTPAFAKVKDSDLEVTDVTSNDGSAAKHGFMPKAGATGSIPVSDGSVVAWQTAPTLAGLLTLTAGQIKFPATQNASSNANTLDDYEEGTWVPVLGGSGGTSGQTYTAQNGYYVKIGSVVWCSYRVQLAGGAGNKGTITGNCEIQGQPFANGSGTQQISTQLVRFAVLSTNWIHIHTLMTSGSSVMGLVGNTAAAVNNTTALVAADIADGTILSGVMVYTVTF